MKPRNLFFTFKVFMAFRSTVVFVGIRDRSHTVTVGQLAVWTAQPGKWRIITTTTNTITEQYYQLQGRTITTNQQQLNDPLRCFKPPVGGAAPRTFAPGGKNPRAATVWIYFQLGTRYEANTPAPSSTPLSMSST